MKSRTKLYGLLGAAMVVGAGALAAPAMANDPVVANLTYRTGPFAPNGIPFANGHRDYFAMINKKGGIDGTKVDYRECETGYKTNVGVECYERLKSLNTVVVIPNSTGITYKLIPNTPTDKIPIHSMGYGMTASADGRYFPYVFNFPSTYWSQATAIIKYMGAQEGGMDKMKGKKIAFLFLESSYGREPIPVLKELSKRLGYKLEVYSVPPKSMQDQRSQWRKIARWKPDWVIQWGWGAMNSTAVQRAAEFGIKRERFIGGWWSGAEQDTIPAGKGAIGYKAATFNPPGTDYKVLQDILKDVYGDDKKKAVENNWGQVLYNRGVFQAAILTEAMREAKKTAGKVTGESMRDALEKINLTAERLEQIGMKGYTKPIKITCADHEGNGPVMIQQWDGKKWNLVSDWITPMRDIVRPKLEETAKKEAAKLNFKKRENCN